MSKIAIGGDHAGYEYKKALIEFLSQKGFEVKDFGPFSTDSVDYPDFAHPLATAVENKEFDFGILICGSGNGVNITANKHQQIRSGLAWNVEVAALIRQHNDANVMALPARFISLELAKACVETFLNTPFEGGRHQNRVNKIRCA
ncbi:MAG: ribose 5-phosphate isomerase B [Cytophagaceae bacterium]|nr:ribose 5-phosphate isomerase B [Cytophagaceae bacterium]